MLKLPDELRNATEEQYAAFVRKALSKNRIGLAPLRPLAFLDVVADQIANLATQTMASVALKNELQDTCIDWLSRCVGNQIDFASPDLRTAALGFTVDHRQDRLPSHFRLRLLSESDSSYHSENTVVDKKEPLGKESAKKQMAAEVLDLSKLSINLRTLDDLVQTDALSAEQKEAIQSLSEIGEWVLLNGPAIQRSLASARAATALPSTNEIKEWTPDRFFKWFETAVNKHLRHDLTKLAKVWISSQAGKHDFENLETKEAVARKQELVKSVMAVVDALGLTIICVKDGCEHSARLRAARRGNSRVGQYFFAHPGAEPGSTVKHSASAAFPIIKLR